MKRFREYLLSQETTQRRDTLWYTAGSMCSALFSMLLTVTVTRILGASQAGVFAIAWSAAQLMQSVGWFSMRQFQVSDVQDQFEFQDYLSSKFLTSAAMLAGGIVYGLAYGYSRQKLGLTFLFCCFLTADVFADVFSGFFQHKGKLHLAGRSYVIRIGLSYLVILLLLCLTQSLTAAFTAALAVSMFWLLVFDLPLAKGLDFVRIRFRWGRLRELFGECVPLFLGSFLLIFIMNVSKNGINTYLSDEVQACYNMIFMPSSVINMFSMFVCVPLYGNVAVAWHNRDRRRFLRLMRTMLLAVTALTGAVLAGGWLLGIPALSWISGLDLRPYKVPLMVLLAAGGLYGMIMILSYGITVMRRQRTTLLIYGISAAGVQLAGGPLIRAHGVMGAVELYLAAMGVICLAFGAVCGYYLIREGDRQSEKTCQ